MGSIVGGIVGGVVSGNASKKAAKINAQTQATNRAFAQQMYDRGAAMVQPTVQRGGRADSYIDGLLGLGGDKAAAENAWKAFRDSSGYQFQLDQAQNATTSNALANGMFGSGATAKALQDRAIQAANTSSQQYLGNLMGVSNQGQNAQNALLGQGNILTNQITNANNSQSQSSQNNALAQGAIWSKVAGDIGRTIDGSNFGKNLLSSFGL